MLTDRTLVVGAGRVAVDLIRVLGRHPELGLRPLGLVDDIASWDAGAGEVPVLGRVADLPRLLGDLRIDRVVIAFGVAREEASVAVLRACVDASVDIYVLPRFFELGFAPRGSDVEDIWGYPLVRLPRTVLRPSPRLAKRALDVTVAAALLIGLAPLYGAIALAVKVTSPGPVHFRQRRVGQHGQVVEIVKFRSMVENDDSETTWNVAGDSRITPLGRFLRDSSLDELPQLWTVIRGGMSLVGPRPERPYFADRFRDTVRHYDDRLRVPVGLTGLAQVRGLRGDTSIAERARLDNHYIENWSLGLDLRILAATVVALARDATGTGPGQVESPDRSRL
jgi:exopolysaccharide biosynthesis polyprenyl glycosylphosphotransferase